MIGMIGRVVKSTVNYLGVWMLLIVVWFKGSLIFNFPLYIAMDTLFPRWSSDEKIIVLVLINVCVAGVWVAYSTVRQWMAPPIPHASSDPLPSACPEGHPFTGANAFRTTDRTRECKRCRRARLLLAYNQKRKRA